MQIFASGRRELPVIKITDSAMEAFGGPVSVDLDAADELLRRDLELERDDVAPQYIFFGRSRRGIGHGLQVPFTKTAFVHVPSNVNFEDCDEDGPAADLTRAFIHGSAHLVQSIDRPPHIWADMGIRIACALGSVGMVHLAHKGLQVPTRAASFLGFHAARHNFLDLGERRAREAEANQALVDKYSGIITIGSS